MTERWHRHGRRSGEPEGIAWLEGEACDTTTHPNGFTPALVIDPADPDPAMIERMARAAFGMQADGNLNLALAMASIRAALAAAIEGEVPEILSTYAGMTIAEVIDDYGRVRGDLSEQYARDQLVSIIEARIAEAKSA